VSITGNNTYVRITLQNYGANLPQVVGTNVIVSPYENFTPNLSGNFSGTVQANSRILPSGTYYQVCVFYNGQQFRCGNYLINSAFDLNSAIPLSSIPVMGMNQVVVQSFLCPQVVAVTTWTCTHNFNDFPVFTQVSDSAGRQIFPDTTSVSNPNVAVFTFLTPQAGNALITHAGSIAIATNQPNAVVQNPVAPQIIQGPPLAVSANTSFTGLLTCKQFDSVRCVDAVNSAGWVGSDVGAWINAALADTPNGGTVRIAPGAYTLSTQVVPTSNVKIECASNTAVLTASASFNAAMVSASGISNVSLTGCTLDGNRSGNANQFGAISLTNATKGKIVGNHFQNFSGGRIVYLSNGSNGNTVQDNEIDHYGQPLPAVANGNEGIALAPSGSGAGTQDNDILHNFIHDGNGGIGVYNSNAVPSVSTNTSNNRILDNRIQGLANDGILLFNSNNTSNGSLIQGTLIKVISSAAMVGRLTELGGIPRTVLLHCCKADQALVRVWELT